MTARMDGRPSGAIFGTFIVNIYLLLYAYRYYNVCDNTYHIIIQRLYFVSQLYNRRLQVEPTGLDSV